MTATAPVRRQISHLRLWLSPDGRIGSEAFLHGWIFVFGMQALCGAALMVAPLWALAPLAMVSLLGAWSGLCLISMRFHDAGMSGWWTAPTAVTLIVASWLLARAADVTPRMGGLLDLSFSLAHGQSLSDAAQQAARAGFALTLAVNLGVCAVIGLVLAWLREEAADNGHGLPHAQIGPLGD